MFNPEATIIHLENQSPVYDRAVRMYESFYAFCAQYYSSRKQRSIRVATVLALLPRYGLTRDSQRRAIYTKLMALPMPLTSRDKS